MRLHFNSNKILLIKVVEANSSNHHTLGTASYRNTEEENLVLVSKVSIQRTLTINF